MTVALVYDPAMAGYRFGPEHPLKPERFVLAVELMRGWGLLAGEEGPLAGSEMAAAVVAPRSASDDDLLLVHDAELVAAVKAAGSGLFSGDTGHGIGPGDTPAFPGMHEVSALIAGGTIQALEAVVGGSVQRTFNPAGGLHHAHRDRVAGFCVYNDCAIAIACATRDHPGLRVAYVDIDAHHGDGVQEAFYDRADVLTVSVHESGTYLYPGTGDPRDIGRRDGTGFAVNMPLPPGAGPECSDIVLADVIGPAVRAFYPDVIVLQGGGDSHRDDPLTHLDNTVAGFADAVAGIVRLADELCDGRLVMTGGGGYEPYSAVPRMWACAMAELLGTDTPATVPDAWLRMSHAASAGTAAPLAGAMTFAEATPAPSRDDVEVALEVTRRVIGDLRSDHPLLAG